MFTRLDADSKKRGTVVAERPWGVFKVLGVVHDRQELIHKQKLLIVKPHTTMQLHKHINYTELWIGETAFDYVVEDDDGNLPVLTAQPFERVFVPKNRKHQIISKDTQLRIFEIQTGSITDDDNIKFS